MPTTTNYGWTTPADTDLVKDGASAIRTLGSAIDTTVFNNASAAIAKTIVDAKGDLIAATAADTVSRLAVGADATVLTADSTTATGLKWATPTSGGMTLLSTTTLSGASVTLSSINQTYTDLVLYVYGMTNATADNYFAIQPLSNTQQSYSYVAQGTASNETANSIRTWISNLDRTDANNGFYLRIHNYTETTQKPFIFYGNHVASGTGAKTSIMAAGNIWGTSAVTSIKLFNNGGNFSTGTVKLWGVK